VSRLGRRLYTVVRGRGRRGGPKEMGEGDVRKLVIFETTRSKRAPEHLQLATPITP